MRPVMTFSWLARVFSAAITDAAVAKRVLDHLGIPSLVPEVAATRDPTWEQISWDESTSGTQPPAAPSMFTWVRFRRFESPTRPSSGDLLGNFPQSFSHLGLINAALRIDLALRLRDEGSTRAPQLVRGTGAAGSSAPARRSWLP